MKYRLAGASYREIAEKLTEEKASEYADANGISVERALGRRDRRTRGRPQVSVGRGLLERFSKSSSTR